MKNRLDIIDWFLVIALGFYLIIGTMTSYGQEINVPTLSFNQVNETIVIEFEDKGKDRLYQNDGNGGVYLYYVPKGSLQLTLKEFDKFKKDAKKTAKFIEKEIKREKYTFNAYPYVEESIFFVNNETNQIGEITLEEVKNL